MNSSRVRTVIPVSNTFEDEVQDILEDNSAVDSIKGYADDASVVAGSRAGWKAKNRIIIDPALHGYDVTYEGCSNGWERYTVHSEKAFPADIDAFEYVELQEHAQEYKRSAGSPNHKPTFGDWLDNNTTGEAR